MEIVWVAPKKKHSGKKEFQIVKFKATQEFDRFEQSIYIVKNMNFSKKDVYFTLTGKELNRWHKSFESRNFRVVAMIL